MSATLACGEADGPVDQPDTTSTPNVFFGKAPAPKECKGEVACACEQDSDCDSGACVESVGGKLCAGPCGDACQGGTVCVQLSVGGAKSSYCVDPNARLCQPCVTDVDCQAAGLFGAACVSHGPRGSFCGVACTPGGSACPEGFVCEAVQAASGVSTPQCVPVGGEDGLPGACPCSPAAVATKAVTPCPSQGGDACSWYAACEAPGQPPVCKPLGAGDEVCDQLDNDCDGQTDEDTCADGGPCNPGGCSGGACKYLVKPDGAACGGVDGDPCSVAGACKAGQCEGAKTVKCDDGKVCTTDACDGKGGCLHTPVAAGTPCDDGNACTSQDGCDGETCSGGAPVSCDDGDPCTDDSCAPASGCVTSFNAAPCSDANSCKAGQCSQGKCVLSGAEGCDDNNLCTHDACEGGKCTNTNTPDQVCDDGDACTSGDTCDPDGAGCKGGALVKCDDGNPCTTDSCDPKVGCVYAPQLGFTVPCYTGPAKTEGVGACVAGKQACDGQGKLGPCIDEVVPVVQEACDGKDDDCDGQTDESCSSAKALLSVAPLVVRGKIGAGDSLELAAQTGATGKSVGPQKTLFWSLVEMWGSW